ncbi:MAG TPA: tripartite tricarboxylate transporter substrate binding protein [Burkholderiales bacterium]
MSRRILAFGLLCSTLWSSSASCDTYPSRPVRVIVPFGTGGPDTVARVMAQALSAQTGQPFVVDNRPGANGIIGAEAVARSKPDGYTVLVTSSSFIVNPSMYRKLPYDTLRDFVPVTQITAAGGLLLVVSPSIPAQSVKELIALARQPGSRLSFGSPGIGNTNHLTGELFNARAEIKMLHVPYKGGGQAISALLAGDVQVAFASSALSLPYVRAGRLRALAYTGRARASYLPDVPTMMEAGVADFEVDSGWQGLYAPAECPLEIVAKLQGGVLVALANPQVRERIATLGLEAVGSTPAEFKLFVQAEIKKYAEMVRAAGIQPE